MHPWGKGGVHSVDNVGLRCRGHNAYEANPDYGPLFMASKREEARSVRETLEVYSASLNRMRCGALQLATARGDVFRYPPRP